MKKEILNKLEELEFIKRCEAADICYRCGREGLCKIFTVDLLYQYHSIDIDGSDGFTFCEDCDKGHLDDLNEKFGSEFKYYTFSLVDIPKKLKEKEDDIIKYISSFKIPSKPGPVKRFFNKLVGTK